MLLNYKVNWGRERCGIWSKTNWHDSAQYIKEMCDGIPQKCKRTFHFDLWVVPYHPHLQCKATGSALKLMISLWDRLEYREDYRGSAKSMISITPHSPPSRVKEYLTNWVREGGQHKYYFFCNSQSWTWKHREHYLYLLNVMEKRGMGVVT